MSKFSIITLLESVLGKGKINANDNVAFHCPFCHHNKKKMEVNIVTQYWHCWVCNAAGRKLFSECRRPAEIIFRIPPAGRNYFPNPAGRPKLFIEPTGNTE